MVLRRANLGLKRALDWTIAGVHGAVVVILFSGVVLRYLFNYPLFWAEEISLLGLVWMTFLGGAVLERGDKNVAITLLTDLLPKGARRAVRFVSDLLVMFITAVMVKLSWDLAGRLSMSTTPALRMSEDWFAFALVAGFAVMLSYQIQRFVASLRGREAFPEERGGDPEKACRS